MESNIVLHQVFHSQELKSLVQYRFFAFQQKLFDMEYLGKSYSLVLVRKWAQMSHFAEGSNIDNKTKFVRLAYVCEKEQQLSNFMTRNMNLL